MSIVKAFNMLVLSLAIVMATLSISSESKADAGGAVAAFLFFPAMAVATAGYLMALPGAAVTCIDESCDDIKVSQINEKIKNKNYSDAIGMALKLPGIALIVPAEAIGVKSNDLGYE